MRVIVPPVTAPEPLLGRAYKNAEQTLPFGAWTPVSFEAVTDAAGGAMTTNGFTAPAAGVYDVSVAVIMYSVGNIPQAGDYINIAVRKNGAEAMKIAEVTLGAAGGTSAIGAGPLRLAAGDVLQVWAYTRPGRAIFGAPATEVTTFSVANWRP